MDEKLITVKQLPIIEEHLLSIKQDIEQRVNEILSLVCTEETVTTVKKYRSELNAQFKDLEDRRKAVKAAVMAPYEQFNEIYRECVSDIFASADRQLKAKIDAVESDIKNRCEQEIRDYFAELCAAYHVEWINFDNTGIKVDMVLAKQKNPKKLKEKAKEFVEKVASDVEAISQMDNSAEIMVEYKRSYNIALAIQTVMVRNKMIAEEVHRKGMYDQQMEAQKQAESKVEQVYTPVPVAQEKQETEKVFTATFTVKATKDKLIALKKFMADNSIELVKG